MPPPTARSGANSDINDAEGHNDFEAERARRVALNREKLRELQEEIDAWVRTGRAKIYKQSERRD